MIIIKKGDLLSAKENLLAHQANENGIMGGGLALQIAKKYPHIELSYKEFCENKTKEELLGKTLIVNIEPGKDQFIVNCFSQNEFYTQYNLILEIFTRIKKIAKENNYTIALPWKYGCGIATGDWNIVMDILLNIFTDYDLTIYKLEEK